MKIVLFRFALAVLVLIPVSGMCKADSKGAGAATTAGMGGGDVPSAATGKVVETMTAGGYTYANLKKNGKTGWVAFSPTTVKVGQELSFTGCMLMTDFKSKALNRTFPKIMFCSAPLADADAKLLNKKSTGSNVVVPTSTEKIVIKPLKGKEAHTVADCFAKSSELDKKIVEVKGKVMKVSSRIMGRNWVHIQDGSGSSAMKNNNLVVTMQQTPKVGSVITISGTLYKNKDFGSGYKYNVIVEQATIK